MGLYPNYEKMYGYLKDSGVRMYVVMDTDAKGAARYEKQQKSNIPVLLDPKQASFKQFGLTSSPATSVIGADGSVAKFDHGCSKSVLRDTVAAAFKLVDKPTPKMEFKDAPDGLTFG